MGSSIKYACQTCTGTTGSGNADWVHTVTSLTADLASSDDVYVSTNPISNTSTSKVLKCTNWGFTIPTGAEIVGIEAVIEIYASSANCQYVNGADSIKLVKDGSATGTAKNGGTISTTASNTDTFGGSTDLWGATLAPSDINGSGFGIQFRVTSNAIGNKTVYVDNIQLTVYYTLKSSMLAVF